MKKISLNSSKLGELRLPQDHFLVPQVVGQVVSARITARRDDSNNAIEGSVAKISLETVNFKTLQTIQPEGGDVADLARQYVEVIADEIQLKSYHIEQLMGQLIDLQSAQVALRWVNRRSIGQLGRFLARS